MKQVDRLELLYSTRKPCSYFISKKTCSDM